MNEVADFQGLMTRVRQGEPGATAELCRWFEPYIRAAVRRQLHPRLRTQFDSIDFVQDVWSSFLVVPARQNEFESPDALLGFLNKMAYNRVVEVFRQRFETKKHDINRERPADGDAAAELVAARTASPSQAAIAAEQWDRLLGQVPEGHRVIVERLRDGYTYAEISAMTSVSVSTINRIIRRLKDLTAN